MVQPTPTPPPDAAAKRKAKRGSKDRRSCDGKLKLAVRFHNHQLDGPWTIFSDTRFNRNFDAALAQLLGVIEKPKFKGKVAWAEIYDCSASRFGPTLATYKQGQWHYHNNH
ncbi:hypothetical protein [Neolewinella agarilytica]|uniref:Uncharacterized protein n=1 Tax=Neolewinella agarilytica TaxID=478744 RepID=A0A1H9LYQ1_9BACT|nr:hypothetical protein [Neolewinella agarilytica]SER16561.1 hypothetical protein SAMN05444359_12642 [Neolewinella agarilytica]